MKEHTYERILKRTAFLWLLQNDYENLTLFVDILVEPQYLFDERT